MDKLRQKITVMRQNGRAFTSKIMMKAKYCRNCKREFVEGENFNWSCCVHRGEWGGDIWWCCGKTNKGAIGMMDIGLYYGLFRVQIPEASEQRR